MYFIITISVILSAIFAILGERKIFLMIGLVKKTLISSLIVLVFIFTFSAFKDNRINISFEILVILNIIQLLLWYFVEKRWDRDKYLEFYLKAWERDNIKGFIIIVIPTMLNSYFISQTLAATLKFIGIQIF